MARRKKASFGQTLLAAAAEAVGIEKGRLAPSRVTRHKIADARIDRPPRYGAKRIRRIRVKMDLSQPLFAAALNVSPETIRAWEQGKRAPDGPTLRLLEVAEEHPDVFLEKVRIPRVARAKAS
jgi:putative transcriptional regulator